MDVDFDLDDNKSRFKLAQSIWNISGGLIERRSKINKPRFVENFKNKLIQILPE